MDWEMRLSQEGNGSASLSQRHGGIHWLEDVVTTWFAVTASVLTAQLVTDVSAVDGECRDHLGAVVPGVRRAARNMPQVPVAQARHGNAGVIAVLQLVLSFPGRRRSLKECMLITASVFVAGGWWWSLCFTRLSHVNDSLISSITALQKDLLMEKKTHGGGGGVEGKEEISTFASIRRQDRACSLFHRYLNISFHLTRTNP